MENNRSRNVPTRRRRRKSIKQFPGKLHDMMTYVEQQNLESTISWTTEGNGIIVHCPEKLLDILPEFFGQTKYRSFQRQLNMWHFERILDGPDKGAFVHPYFVKGNKALCACMSRHEFETPSQQHHLQHQAVPLPIWGSSKTDVEKALGNPPLAIVPTVSDIKISVSSWQNDINNPVKTKCTSTNGAAVSDDDSSGCMSDFLEDLELGLFEGRSFYTVDGSRKGETTRKASNSGMILPKGDISNCRVSFPESARNLLSPLFAPISSDVIDSIFDMDEFGM